MKKILSEKLPRILKNKKKLEETLKITIKNRGKEVYISGNPTEEYTAEKVIDAINFGFPIQYAIEIKEQEFIFEILNIKDYTKRKDLAIIRARIIGKEGKTLKTLNKLTKCYFELKDNEIGIIGHPEYIENAQNAVVSIIQGSKQGNVYSFLEKHQVQPIDDLGLKE
jgi:ribosomal RNA assembly protein